ncbi:SdpI family protein, partial [Clavibacter michiganensis]|uniref:SdpI family protein n=1 Tax=Clavibacter michiganensis TaxID=28447 RepID=UPI002930BF06
MGVPALLLAVAALLILGTTQLAAWGLLKRNGWIGIRTRPLMASDEAWRAGHVAALPALRSTCLPVAIGGVIGGIAAGAGMNSVDGVVQAARRESHGEVPGRQAEDRIATRQRHG